MLTALIFCYMILLKTDILTSLHVVEKLNNLILKEKSKTRRRGKTTSD